MILYTSANHKEWIGAERFLKTKQNKIKKELKLNVNNNVNLSKEKLRQKSVYGRFGVKEIREFDPGSG